MKPTYVKKMSVTQFVLNESESGLGDEGQGCTGLLRHLGFHKKDGLTERTQLTVFQFFQYSGDYSEEESSDIYHLLFHDPVKLLDKPPKGWYVIAGILDENVVSHLCKGQIRYVGVVDGYCRYDHWVDELYYRKDDGTYWEDPKRWNTKEVE